MLEIQNLSYRVADTGGAGAKDILRGVSLTIPDKRFIVITGPNGGGKTTLAKTIMGINQPTGGKILWNGTDMTNLSITERAKLGVSYGFQQPPRFKGFRVRDLLSVAAGRTLNTSEACDYLTRVGLCARNYLERDVDASLSGGEVKRIEIATILARRCPLMIFDEPEAGIDLWSFARLTETFQEIHDKKEATILIISHQERIIRLADEILLVADGKISAKGSVEEIYPIILGDTVQNCNRLEVDACAE
ncbi:MAG: ATP-binding cassette domain-containing protein [Oscillospiraceae bacterium]|jgi:Fe-S cluster assembly ATP-binding protein|nr:ATP-binding cassette domain-containing protein [Oscillospiraceae bacterium]